MSDLTSTAIEAHGGLERFNHFESVTAHFRTGGALWGLKEQAGVFRSAAVRVDLHRQHASHYPFTAPHLRTSVTPERAAIESESGEVKAERLHPRAAFAGHTLRNALDEPPRCLLRRLRDVDSLRRRLQNRSPCGRTG